MDELNDLPTEELARRVGWALRGRPLNTREAAELRGLRPNTLEIERTEGKGPPYMQPARIVTYSERDVLLWMLASRRTRTRPATPAQAAGYAKRDAARAAMTGQPATA